MVVQSEKAHFPVSVLCEAVGVSRSAFYAWCRATPSERKLANERVLTEIRAIHTEHGSATAVRESEPNCGTEAFRSVSTVLRV